MSPPRVGRAAPSCSFTADEADRHRRQRAPGSRGYAHRAPSVVAEVEADRALVLAHGTKVCRGLAASARMLRSFAQLIADMARRHHAALGLQSDKLRHASGEGVRAELAADRQAQEVLPVLVLKASPLWRSYSASMALTEHLRSERCQLHRSRLHRRGGAW